MDKLKSYGLVALVCAVCFSAGKFLTPPKVEIKEVEKIVYREKSETKTDTQHTSDKRETIMPDGTRIIETVSTTQRSTDKKSNASLNQETTKSQLTETRKDWHVTLTYLPVIPGHQVQDYSVDIQRRILSELYLGASLSSQKTIGISIGIGF